MSNFTGSRKRGLLPGPVRGTAALAQDGIRRVRDYGESEALTADAKVKGAPKALVNKINSHKI